MTLRDDLLALDPALVASRNDVAIAAAFSVGRVKIVPCEVGKLTVLATLGMDAGNSLLDIVDNTPDFRHVKGGLAEGRLDVGHPLTRAMIDQICSPADAIMLKALAECADPVSVEEVSEALNHG